MFIISFLILVGIVQSVVDPCTRTTPLTNVVKVINETGNGDTDNGYSYEMWTNTEGGNNTVSLYDEEAAFKAEWSNPDDFLGRVGLRWRDEAGDIFSNYGNIIAEYAYTRSENNTGGPHYNYIGIYGWAYPVETKGIPLVEYYIIDDWFGNDYQKEDSPITEYTLCPDSDEERLACQKGSFTVDGAQYKIYSNIRRNQPSILGTATFTQYFSIRQNTRKCGTITISEHFKKWNSIGLRMGKLYEASLLVEVQSGTGFLDYSHAKVVVNALNDDVTTPIGDYPPACVDRTPSGGSCADSRDQADAPPCFVQPGDAECGLSCPIDYEPVNGKCVVIVYDDGKCRARAVQKTDCKDTAGSTASCDLFGCGPYCYLNVAKKGCSLPCGAGEAVTEEAGSRHCERAPCPNRIPRAVTQSLSSHSASNDAVNFDVSITVEKVEFANGWKSGATVKITVAGNTKTSTAVQEGDSTTFNVNEIFEWNNVAPASLTSVGVNIPSIGKSMTIDISDDSTYKVGSVAEGTSGTFSYTDSPDATWDNSFTIFLKVAVMCPSNLVFAGTECVPNTSWRCGSPSEGVLCYADGNTCTETCSNGEDNTTGACISGSDGPDDPDGSYTHVARWGGWAVCLLIVILFL